MIDSDVFDFVERCRKHTATGPLLSDLLETVRNLGFEHLILSGVPLGG
ncbi:MAG: autoinducer-binding protein, partial [Mesorhizobium sp.]